MLRRSSYSSTLPTTVSGQAVGQNPDGERRVRISGTRRSPPPDTLKVAPNDVGGYRNTRTPVLTGLDIEAKAAHAEALLFEVLGGRDRFAEVDVRLLRFDRPEAPRNVLGGYAGFHTTTPPTAESAFGGTDPRPCRGPQ